MTIYVGLVTYNSSADLPHCIAGLRAQTHPHLQIIAFDNASSDGCAAWLREHAPEVRLIVNSENLGYGRAHNAIIQGAAVQPGDYYMALNPDAELTPDYIALLVEVLNAHPDAGWATGKLLMNGETGVPSLYSAGHGMLRSGFAFNIGYGLPDSPRFASSCEVFGAPGAAVIYKAELIADISQAGHFFDPGMFMYAEDTDVDWRAQRQGWRCWFVAQAVAFHRGSRPAGRLQAMAIANRYVSVLKNAAVLQLITFNAPYIIAHCVLRLLVTPRFGLWLAASILRRAPSAVRQRRPAKADPRELERWFRWSAEQPTEQRSRLARLLRR